MSRTHKDAPKHKQARSNDGKGRRHNIRVRGVQRAEPDLRKLSRALIELAMAQAEADAQSQASASDAVVEATDD
jgi:hypothetical protein